jgi:hypothetical protein
VAAANFKNERFMAGLLVGMAALTERIRSMSRPPAGAQYRLTRRAALWARRTQR